MRADCCEAHFDLGRPDGKRQFRSLSARRLHHCHCAGEQHRFQSLSAAELILHALARGDIAQIDGMALVDDLAEPHKSITAPWVARYGMHNLNATDAT